MEERYQPPTRRGGRRFRRALRWGLVASTALHAAVFLLWRGGPVPATEAGGSGARAAPRPGGGGGMRALSVRVPERRSIPAPPRPIPVPGRPEISLEEPPSSALAVAPLAAPGPVRPGRGTRGDGDGSDAGSGDGPGRVSPPVPRSLFPEWDPPDEVRGTRVTVRVRVDAEGRPTGEVELRPPTPNRAFNRKLRENVTRMEYYPARREGRAVPGWAEITFVF